MIDSILNSMSLGEFLFFLGGTVLVVFLLGLWGVLRWWNNIPPLPPHYDSPHCFTAEDGTTYFRDPDEFQEEQELKKNPHLAAHVPPPKKWPEPGGVSPTKPWPKKPGCPPIIERSGEE